MRDAAHIDCAPMDLIRGSRVSQLDAHILDAELSRFLSDQILHALESANPEWGSAFKQEVEASIDLAILSSTVLSNRQTPGMRLNNLMFGLEDHRKGTNETYSIIQVPFRTRLFFVIGVVGSRWIWRRLLVKAAEEEWRDEPATSFRYALYTVMRRVRQIMAVITVINLVLFLRYGQYRSAIERALGMRLVPVRERAQNPMQFSNQNLQLISNTFSEMMFLVVPLVNWARLRRIASASFVVGTRFILSCAKKLMHKGREFLSKQPLLASLTSRSEANVAGNDEIANQRDKDHTVRDFSCAICNVSEVVIPYISQQCPHTFCYVCLQSLVAIAREDRQQPACPRCQRPICRTARRLDQTSPAIWSLKT